MADLCCLTPVAPNPREVVPADTAAPSRLLLIEADEPVATALSRGLGRYGWAVLRAPTAKAGLQLQIDWVPNVVLLASGLPDMPVGQLVARLAEQGGCAILLLSGHENDDLRRVALARGAHGVMSKPVRAKELAECIRAAQRCLSQPVLAPTQYGGVSGQEMLYGVQQGGPSERLVQHRLVQTEAADVESALAMA
jgi:DNA-binding response OmpR family regulator